MKTIKYLCVAVMAFTFHLSPLPLAAQHHAPRVAYHTLSFESHHGESYTVFIDGDVMNRMPQSRVVVSDVASHTHEVVVVLKRPVQKAAVLHLRPAEPNVLVNVDYDERLGQLSLYTPAHNVVDPSALNNQYLGVRIPTAALPDPQSQKVDPSAIAVVQGVSNEDFNAMVGRMKEQTFDSERLALGKVIVASSNLTSLQIGGLAATLDYSSSQVELLKYAYHYCIDPENYYKATDILTFSTDKKKVLEYIATR